jgi:hypothetical protein
MDELTLLGEFRSDMPEPTAAETAAARDVLLAAMAEVRPGPAGAKPPARRGGDRATRGGRAARRFWIPVAAGMCAAAVGIAAAAVMAPGPRAIRPAAKPAVLTAAVVLRKAASVAANQIAGHGRFFVSESEYIDPGNGRNVPAQRTIWIGNGVTGRLLDRGWGGSGSPIPPGLSFGRRVITWAQLLRLPTAPGPLLAMIGRASRDNGQPLVQAEFSTIVGLLFESPTTPALRAALYLAASRLPGVTLVPAAHDLIGRPAAEVYVPPGFTGSGGDALFFDPSTSAVLGVATLVGSKLQCPPAWEAAVLAAGYVNSTFQLPPSAPASLRPVTWRRGVPGCPAPTSGQASASPSPGAGAIPTPGVTPSQQPASSASG